VKVVVWDGRVYLVQSNGIVRDITINSPELPGMED